MEGGKKKRRILTNKETYTMVKKKTPTVTDTIRLIF
jgi:hypothetical protein